MPHQQLKDLVVAINSKMQHGMLPSFRDTKHRTIELPTAYAASVYADIAGGRSEIGATNTKMKKVSTALKQFTNYLMNRAIKPDSATIFDDIQLDTFKGFCKWLVSYLTERERPSVEREAQDTANEKIAIVYDFLAWAQIEKLIPPNTIGHRGCRIKSTRVLVLGRPDLTSLATSKRMYPLLYSGTGKGGRGSAFQHFPTPLELQAIDEVFQRQPDKHAGARNRLLTVIGTHRGWRASSVLSLTTDQFSDAQIERCEKAGLKTFEVTPPFQKGAKHKSFGLPWALTYRIRQYIRNSDDPEEKGGRQLLMEAARVTEEQAKEHIFLACGGIHRGHPLTAQSLSEIFSDAFQLIGASDRAAYHSLRRGFGDGYMRREIEFRQREGLSTEMKEVVAAVSMALGQSSQTAYRAYVRVMLHKTNHSNEEALIDQVNALQNDVERGLKAHETLRLVLEDERRMREDAQSKVKALETQVKALQHALARNNAPQALAA